MAKAAKLISIFLLLVLAVQGNAAEKLSLAVYDFNANQVTPVLADSVADFIQTALYTTGRFNLVERKNISKILKEQAFQKTGCTTTECAVEVGRILNVSNIIAGTVSKTGQMLVISIQLVDVEKGDIILSDKIECDSEDLLNNAATLLAAHFSKGVAVKGKIVKIISDNEVIVNLGARDGIEKDQELTVERLGDAVKDETGAVVYQKRSNVAKVQATDVSEAASNFRVLDKSSDLKATDIIELKKEKLAPLPPLTSKFLDIKQAEAVKPAEDGGRHHFGVFFMRESELDVFQDKSTVKTLTVQPRKTLGLAYGGTLFGGNIKWLADFYVTAAYSFNLLGPADSDFNPDNILNYYTIGLGTRFYPLTPVLNPGYDRNKNGREQRGFFAPYVSAEALVYYMTFNESLFIGAPHDPQTNNNYIAEVFFP